ncbi:MAG: HAMP domain-containing sensor histidine kinase [Bacillota bacterium]|nr:HAMP domain-containing sensor histidine kinase [Bacillota bacterium]
MSIKSRLIVSYIAMLIVPIILSIIATIFIGSFYIHSLQMAYNVKLERKESIEKFINREGTLFQEVQNTAKKSPDNLKNTSYLKSLDEKLQVINTGIIVRQNSKILYASKSVDKEVTNGLPSFGSNDGERKSHPLIGDKILNQLDFHFSDGSEGSFFTVTDIALIKNTAIKFIITVVMAIIAILVFTNAFLTFLVSRSIIKPLESLKSSALQIKNGNLDMRVRNNFNDEIGEVCLAFEEMRIKLKESLSLQQQYENNRKELISNISHDLKTPITAIKGYVEGITDGVADSPEKIDKYIKTIATKANDLDRLIDELFLFSKLDLNKLPFNFEVFDIKSYLEDCVEELQFDFDDRNVRINLETCITSSFMVSADREKLKRVIINIVSNSVKYMDKDYGKIKIELIDAGEFAQIKIQDNGQGIPEENLKFIFERFYRVDPSRNTSTGGSGLGLAITKLIIEEHGGKIWAESVIGEGTAVFFTLRKI